MPLGQRTLAVRATILAIGVLLLCLMWVYVLYQTRAERTQAMANATRDTANLTIAFEEQTQRTIAAIEQTLEFLKLEYERDPTGFAIRESFERVRGLRDITFQLSLIGPDGILRGSSLDQPPGALDLSDREHFRVHLGSDSGGVFISRPLIGRASNRRALNISRRLNAPDGSLAGVMVLSFNPDTLVRLYGNVDLGLQGEMLLVGLDGVVRALGSRHGGGGGQDISGSAFFRRAKATPVGSAELPGPIDGIPRIYAFQQIDDQPTIVSVGISRDEIFARVDERERNRLVLLGAVTLAIILFLASLIVEVGRRQRREDELEQERETLSAATGALAQAKAQADEKTRLLETTLLNMSDGISAFDQDLRLRVWNSRFLDLAGVDEKLARVGTHLREILIHQAERGEFGPIDDPAAEATRRLAIVRARPFQMTERMRPDGRYVELRRTVQSDGTIITLYTDVSPRRRAAVELERARDMAEQALAAKSRFLAVVSHEIRTPMNGVIGTLELLADTGLSRGQRRYVEIARSSAEALISIINDILDLSRLEADRMPLVSVDFDLQGLLRSTAGLFSAAADSKGIEVQVFMAPDVPRWCRGDAGRLRQVLVNLMSNAVKFTAAGDVRLSVERVSSRRGVGDGPFELRFLIADSGPGVAPGDRDKLFRPFFQLDSRETRGGSGLGLAIVKGLVDRFGGSLGLADRAGGGAVFWVRLPLLPGSPVVSEALPDPVAAVRATAAFNILVAEDSPVNQLIASEQLRSAGHTVAIASNGREAVEMAASGGYDLILMDVIMPELDGIEAARQIRCLPPPAGTVPIVALTANVMSEDRARILTSGMDGVLGKPFNRARLLDMVARFARHPSDDPAAADAPAADQDPASAASGDPMALEFDPEPLQRMKSDIGEAVATRLARMFLGELVDRRLAMMKAMEAGDMVDLRRIAHTIKGGAQTFGLMRLAEVSLALEHAAERGQDEGLATMVAVTETEAERALALFARQVGVAEGEAAATSSA